MLTHSFKRGRDKDKAREHYWTKTPTIHTVTFGVAHIETGGLHVRRTNIPPFILVTQAGLSACRTLLTGWRMNTMKNTVRKLRGAKTKLTEEKRQGGILYKSSEFSVRFIPSEKVPGGHGEQVALSLL